MFRRFEVLLVSAFFSPIIYGMNVPMLNRAVSMPQWEKNELTRLVGQYERVGYDPSLPDARMFKQFKNTVNGVQIAKDFVDSCCTSPYDRLDSNLRSPLEAMINNPIGRELVYITMAKVLPRKRGVDSIKQFLGTLGRSDEMGDINAIYNFGCSLGVPLRASTNGLITSFSDGGRSFERLKKLHEDPITVNLIPAGVCRVSVGHDTSLGRIRSLLISRITSCVDMAEQKIRELLFCLRFNPNVDDSFNPTARVISFSGKSPNLTFMSTPMLKDDYGLVAVCTVRKEQSLEEILFHEFSHYFGITVEKRSYGGLRRMARALFHLGFSRNYLSGMDRRWTNTEEIRAIVGIFVESGNLFYDYLNESEFNLVAGRSDVRIAHSNLAFTRVPYQLLQFIEAGRGEILTEVRSQTVDYDSVLDCI